MHSQSLFDNFLQQLSAIPQQRLDAGFDHIANGKEAASMGEVEARRLHFALLNRMSQQNQFRLRLKEEWAECERKLFAWLLGGMLAIRNKDVASLDPSDWELLSQMTTKKPIALLKFMGFSLCPPIPRPIWSVQEDNLLLELLIEEKKFKPNGEWTNIAKELFLRGDQTCFKTAKNCRERWFNHLDPALVKDWTKEEDLILLRAIAKEGKKWAQIAVKMGGRKSEHMVKNRYNSILRKARKQGAGREQQIVQKLIEQLRQGSPKNQKIGFKAVKSEGIKSEANEQKQQIRIITIPPKLQIIAPETTNKPQDPQNDIRLIVSKNYSQEGDFEPLQTDEPLQFLLLNNIVKQDSILDQPNNDPRDLRFNESICFGHPSPLTPTPQPGFLSEPSAAHSFSSVGRFLRSTF